jgi:hypothetical protein
MKLRYLRFFLLFAALTWGASIFGVFLSWTTAAEALEALGAHTLHYDKMLDYWLRMAAGAFTLIGCWYLLLAIQPHKFAPAIPWFGGLMLIEGLILLFHGLRLSLQALPFCADVAACFIGGGGILFFSTAAKARG